MRERIFKFKLRNGNFLTKERLRKRKKNSRKSDKNMSGKSENVQQPEMHWQIIGKLEGGVTRERKM